MPQEQGQGTPWPPMQGQPFAGDAGAQPFPGQQPLYAQPVYPAQPCVDAQGQPIYAQAIPPAYPTDVPFGYAQTQMPPNYGPSASGAVPPPQAAQPAAATPIVVTPEASKRHGWIVALVLVIAFALVCLFGIAMCTGAVTSITENNSIDDSSALAYVNADSVAVFYMTGDIDYNGTLCSPEGLKYALDQAEANDSIKAVVIRIDSGGGLATAGEEMTEYLRDFTKPVVVSVASMDCSAAYEITSQADYIYACKTSSVGAIGTVMQLVDYADLYDMLGIRVENIASAESKDSSYGSRHLTEKERAYYQEMVDQINECFVQNVADGRSMSVEQVRELATGLTFTGITGVENGLIDEIGQLEDAIAKAAELAGLAEGTYEVVSVQDTATSYDVMDLLGMDANATTSPDDLLMALKELS